MSLVIFKTEHKKRSSVGLQRKTNDTVSAEMGIHYVFPPAAQIKLLIN